MKVLLFIMFILLLTGCNIKDDAINNVKMDVEVEKYENRAAIIENSIEISEFAMYSPVRRESCFSHIYVDVMDLYPNSENIVSGTVVDVIYSDEGASAVTYCTFAVDEVLKGTEIEKNTLITISLLQGYCRISKYAEVYGNDHFPNFDMSNGETTYFVYSFDGEPLVQNGEKFVLFLSPEQESDLVEGTYYIPIGTFMGRYKLNEEGLYQRYSPDEEFYAIINERTRSIEVESPMTFDELKQTIVEAAEGE